ncbi:MAG: hydroxymethylbilane synthase [Desulfobacterales bacterium]|nr:hydroxymethylbilane synthase [Desulfobacterales bacterium]
MAASVTIGTRGSKLALWQANWVKSQLQQHHGDLTVNLEIIKTRGDKILDVPLAKVGGKGLFVKEIEEALLDGRADLAVHSMKDMPADLPDGLCIGPIPLREDPRDVLISRDGLPLEKIAAGARVGTCSLRRAAQLRHLRPDIDVVPLRGNLETRLRKLDEGQMEATILAAAGIKRMGYQKRISEFFEIGRMLPAVAQGALCIEIRQNDGAVEALVAPLNHADTQTVILGERAFLNRLQGGCQVPIAGHGRLDGNRFSLVGLVADLDGQTVIRDTLSGPAHEAREIGVALADRLIEAGARKILDSLQENGSDSCPSPLFR